MIDVNKITSTLAKLPDQQLQQYAQMHKSDPYIMALAMSESNRRKEMRAAGQGMQGMQEQPKVVDQMVAEMAPQQLPEEMGIGQLPAGEMNFAGGGIVAFADGGGVERYQDQGLVRPQFLQDIMGLPQRYTEYQQRIREEDERKAESDRRMAEAKRQRLEAQQKTSFANYLFGSPQREAEGKAQLAQMAGPTAAQQQAEYIRQQDMLMAPALKTPRRQGDEFAGEEQLIAARAAAAPPAAGPVATPTGGTKPAGSRPGAPASTGSTPSKQFDVSAMMSAELAKQRAAPDPLEADRAALAADRKALAESNVTGLEAIQKNFDNIFSGRKARMDTREGEIGKMKDQTLGLALLNAGATMMSTRGNLGTAIGAGIGVGSKQYVDGMGRIEAAKEKLSTARDRLEELEAQRGELSARELFKANQDVKQVGISVKDDMIKARMAFNNESYAKAEKAVTAQLNANLEVYKQQQANLRTDKTVAGAIEARGGAAGTREERLKLDTLKAMAANITNELKDPFLGLPRNAAIKSAKQAELAQINAQLAQMSGLGTMMPASPTGARGGVQFLGYE
jgi:hypothetical protein